MSAIMMKPSTMLSSRTSVRQHVSIASTPQRSVTVRSGTSGYESAGRDIKRAVNKVGDQLADNIDSAERKAGDTTVDAKYEVKSAGRDAQSAVSKGIENVKEGLHNVGDKVADTASAVGDKTKDLLGGGKKQTVDEALHFTE